MNARVFISCGQRGCKETGVANAIRKSLEKQGYWVFVASEEQGLGGTNDSIIKELQDADYYMFIDFERERLVSRRTRSLCKSSCAGGECRGSLFTHQELAIACAEGFENAIFLRQKGVVLEGMAKYMLSNAIEFSTAADAVNKATKAVGDSKWVVSYSRHLLATSRCISEPVCYRAHDCSEGQMERVVKVRIENRRPRRAAFHTIARLVSINGEPLADDRAYEIGAAADLKWAGQHDCYARTILPGQKSELDAFAIRELTGQCYLHSATDYPQKPFIDVPGQYRLTYSVMAVDFPAREFVLQVNVGESPADMTVELVR